MLARSGPRSGHARECVFGRDAVGTRDHLRGARGQSQAYSSEALYRSVHVPVKDADSKTPRRTLKMMRLIFATLLPLLHNGTSIYANDLSSAMGMSQMQLGHGAASGETTDRYTANIVWDSTAPPPDEKQVITMRNGQMAIPTPDERAEAGESRVSKRARIM